MNKNQRPSPLPESPSPLPESPSPLPENLIISQENQEKILSELKNLLFERGKLNQQLVINNQENETKEENLYQEMLDIYDSLEFLINYLDNNSKEGEMNVKALKRLPKFVGSIQEKLLTILGRREVKKIDFNGEFPDYNICQVIDREIRNDVPDKSITKIIRQGFKYQEKILRPVEVITAKTEETQIESAK
ncbi:MAG: nucleotide exchange factor GrpE [Cyanobacterium sp. T60_A2020_053]|nr:nucleotide exchange factor GrpE [Cyanobacterium sp. T60_A2020_053]